MSLRRSKLSAMAPAARENSMIGSVVDACTKAIIPADAPREVISQAAPTDSIKLPKLDARLASQTARKIECRKGESAEGWCSNGLSPPLLLPFDTPDGCAVNADPSQSTPMVALHR